MPSRRRLVLGAVAVASAAAGGWWASRRDAPSDAEQRLWAAQFATPDGGTLALAAFHGRPLVLNFWATWCAPCVKEMPEIDRFSREFSKRQGQVLGLAIDGPAPVRQFLAKVKVGFLIGLGGLDGTDLIHQLGNLQGSLPFTVLVDADGRILQRKMGETSFDELLAWTQHI